MFGPVLLSYVHTYALTLQSVSPVFAFGSTVYDFSYPEGSFLNKSKAQTHAEAAPRRQLRWMPPFGRPENFCRRQLCFTKLASGT
jgi:hypothetical protein